MPTILFVFMAIAISFVESQQFNFRLNGAIDGSFTKTPQLWAENNNLPKVPWMDTKTLHLFRYGPRSSLVIDYGGLSKSVNIGRLVSRYMNADETFDFGLTAHLISSVSSTSAIDPSNVEVHILLHAASDFHVTTAENATEVCATVNFKSESLQSHSVCSLSWPYDTVCLVGRTLDRRWFLGNSAVNVSYSIQTVLSQELCSVDQNRIDTAKQERFIGEIRAPLYSNSKISPELLNSYHSADLSTAEVGGGRPQVTLKLPPQDTFFRIGDLLRLPVHLQPGNNLASLLIRVNASPSLQLSEMRLLHPDWRLSIISDSRNRIAVIRASRDPNANESTPIGGPLLEYDFRIISPAVANLKTQDEIVSVRKQRNHERATTNDEFLEEVVGVRPASPLVDIPTSIAEKVASLGFEIEMVSKTNAAVGLAAIDSIFHLDDDPVITLVPVVKASRIFNYAVIRDSIQRTSLWLYGLTTHSGIIQLWDANCTSSDNNVLKVEPSCRYIFLDGSETRGSENVSIKISRKRTSVTLTFKVFFPVIPVRLEVSDKDLQLIANFQVPSQVQNPTIGSGNDNLCQDQYQRATIRAFTFFKTSQHSSGIDIEISEWIRPLIRVVNNTVAHFDGRYLVGLEPGYTLVHLITAAGQVVASRPVLVTDKDPVSIKRLDALIADDIDVSVTPAGPYIADNLEDENTVSRYFEIVTKLHRISSASRRGRLRISENGKKSQLFVAAQFSDGTSLDLSALPEHWYELTVQSSNNADAAVPRVALFEVAKCRRQHLNKNTGESTAAMSVIRLDEKANKGKLTEEKLTNETLTIVLGVLFGFLLGLLLVITFLFFRRKIATIYQERIDPDGNIAYHLTSIGNSIVNNRVVTYLTSESSVKNCLFERIFGNSSGQVRGAALSPVPINFGTDSDAASCGIDSDEEPVFEQKSKADKNWVWLSKETLERHSVDTRRSHPLLPDATFKHLCCSSGGIGISGDSPEPSIAGSKMSNKKESLTSSSSSYVEEHPSLSFYATQKSLTPESDQNSVSRVSTPCRRNTPRVYAGSECSLRIFPSNNNGSTAALQLMAPDGRLMASGFASRTLDHRRRSSARSPRNLLLQQSLHGTGVRGSTGGLQSQQRFVNSSSNLPNETVVSLKNEITTNCIRPKVHDQEVVRNHNYHHHNINV